MKKLGDEELKMFRDRLELPIQDADISGGMAPYYHPGHGQRADPVHARAPPGAGRRAPGAHVVAPVSITLPG